MECLAAPRGPSGRLPVGGSNRARPRMARAGAAGAVFWAVVASGAAAAEPWAALSEASAAIRGAEWKFTLGQYQSRSGGGATDLNLRGNLGATGKLSRALSRRSVQTRSSAWSQFAHRMLEEQHHAASVHRASATSDMLVPLP